jgi:CRISPR-associated protein (TIGR03986 family)
MGNQVRAPYNFVPIPHKIIRRYGKMDELPPQDRWDPTLCTGEIKVTMTADSPVFVSDGSKEHPDFFRGADGNYQIPGSTLRGLVRENMQILGLGLVRPGEDFQDVNLYYRALADAGTSLRKDLKGQYYDALGIGNNKPAPENVKVGYLHHENAKGDGAYYIVPAKGRVVPLPYEMRDADGKKQRNPMLSPWEKLETPFAAPVRYWKEGNRWKIAPMDSSAPNESAGWLVRPGFMNKQNHAYLIPAEDPDAEKLVLSGEDLLSYREDYEGRKNSLGGTRCKDPQEKERKKAFWALPEPGKSKPVFYLIQGSRISFSPSSYYLRIAYQHPLREGLCAEHREQTNPLFLDYPYSILGFAGQTESLRSRVSFGNLPVNGTPQFQQAPNLILGEPKMSFFPAYVQQGKSYNEEDFQLRGYKQYWLHDPKEQAADSHTNVQSGMRPMSKGTSFTGTIRYENLYPDELGLLLWCLRLEEGCYQPIGKGKPYGYGRMKLTIDQLRQFDPSQLYGGLVPTEDFFAPAETVEEQVDQLIRTYQQSPWVTEVTQPKKEDAEENGKKKKKKKDTSIQSMPHIKQFFTIRRQVMEPSRLISYMALGDYKNVSEALGSINQVVKEAGEPKAP